MIQSGQRPTQAPPAAQDTPQHPNFGQPPPYTNQQYNQFPNQPYGGPPPPYGFNGPPPGRGFPGYPPYGGPPGWPGPPPPGGRGFPGQFPPPGPFSPQNGQMPFGAPGPQQHGRGPFEPQNRATPPGQQAPATTGPSGQPTQPTQILQRPPSGAHQESKPVAEQRKSQVPSPAPGKPKQPPPPPVESKPDTAAAVAPPASLTAPQNQANGPKPGKIAPAIPLPSPAKKQAVKHAGPNNGIPPMPPVSKPAASAALQQQNATTEAATAAVAAAMAKLGPAPSQPAQHQAQPKPVQGPGFDVVDNLTKKVNEMRVDHANKTHNMYNSNNTSGYRGRSRGGRGRGGHRGIEVPNSDFDFQSANAQFKKEELSKETSAESPTVNGEGAVDGANADVFIPPPAASGGGSYDAKASFFDNISSEAKDREDVPAAEAVPRGPRGREFRNEDRRRNLETFGIGSVDGGYRGGYRGRGRGRGFRGGYRGRGRGRGAILG